MRELISRILEKHLLGFEKDYANALRTVFSELAGDRSVLSRESLEQELEKLSAKPREQKAPTGFSKSFQLQRRPSVKRLEPFPGPKGKRNLFFGFENEKEESLKGSSRDERQGAEGQANGGNGSKESADAESGSEESGDEVLGEKALRALKGRKEGEAMREAAIEEEEGELESEKDIFSRLVRKTQSLRSSPVNALIDAKKRSGNNKIFARFAVSPVMKPIDNKGLIKSSFFRHDIL